MKKSNKSAPIALLAGGYSPEGVCAVWSAKHIEKLFQGDEEYQTYLIYVNKDGWYYEDSNNNEQKIHIDRNNFSLTLPNQETIKFKLAFLLIGGAPGEDGQIQGYLQISNVPFIGCNLLSSAITFNKSIANRIVRSFNSSIIHVSPSIDVFRSVSVDDSLVLHALETNHFRLPLIVKPADSGSSLGVTKITEISQLNEAFNVAFKESNQILVEQFIDGRELTVGLFKINGDIQVLPITEIVHQRASGFFDSETKFEGSPETQVITPANLNEEIKKRVEIGVRELYEKLNLSGLVRIDLMLRLPDEKIFFLEVNTAPSQTEYSIIMQQMAQSEWAGDKRIELYKQLFKEVL
uniref:D-alanyl-D-alanine ligase-like protein n=1 Tax=Adineta vaga TaxID=104782 RepID=B3G438_ADIVA|nr:D-alanyl-D-alanine ligase-like protein [Adineta vaga]